MSETKLKPEYIKPFIESINNVFSTMLNMQASAQKPFIDKQIPLNGTIIVSTIGIAGDIRGNISVIINKDLALKIASAFLCTEFTEITHDVNDAVGELTNMIVGGAKKIFSDQGDTFKIAVPTIMVGEIQEIYANESVPALYLPHTTCDQLFYVKVCIDSES